MSPAIPNSTNPARDMQLATGHVQAGRILEAEALCRGILQVDPLHAWAMHLLGVAAFQERRLPEGAALMRYSIELDPTIADFHNNVGTLEAAAGRKSQAEAAFRSALQARPGYREAETNLANALREQGRLQEAEAMALKTLASHPGNAEAHNIVGTILELQGRVQEAQRYFDEAVRLNPDYVQARLNRAMGLLRLGDFERGWKEYEWRCRQAKMPYQRKWQVPRWDGSDLKGKTLLLHTEGGLGNIIQFSRFVPLLAERGATIVLECPQPLMRILSTLKGPKTLVPVGQRLPHFDVEAPLMSVPALLNTSLQTLPTQVPYLTPDAGLVRYFHDKIQSDAGLRESLRVGIMWQGNPSYANDAARSIPLRQFEPLAKIPSVSLVSLQQGPGLEQLRSVQFRVAEVDGPTQPTDGAFTNAAALMRSLDLVVTSDTSIAHLAGAMGTQVWVALSSLSCWRWMLDQNNSPWYPGMRLFRQSRPSDWEEVFAGMTLELAKLVRDGTPQGG